MWDEGGASDDEADDVTDHDDTDHKVEVKKLRGFEERLVRIEFRTKEAGELAHVRQNVMTGSKEVHANSDASDEEWKPLGITNVDQEALELVGAFSDWESVWKGVGNIECHGAHPEEKGNESMLNDVAKNFTEDRVQ